MTIKFLKSVNWTKCTTHLHQFTQHHSTACPWSARFIHSRL